MADFPNRDSLIVRVDRQGRITLPAQFRKKLQIKPGDTLLLEWDQDRLRFIVMSKRSP